jgi:hypothetical protein
MDHLPLPHKPLLDPIEVPYRCTEPYDDGPMFSYPSRHGWEVLYSPWGIDYLYNDSKPSDHDLESFIQNWLYFGLLHEAFGNFTPLSQYIRQNANVESIITTRNLVTDMEQWSVEMKSLVADGQALESVPSWKLMHRSLGHVWKVALNSKSWMKENVVDQRIWLSIACLSEVIEQLMLDICADVEQPFPSTYTWRDPKNPPIGTFILEEMREKGWCPFDVKRIDLTTLKAGLLYYLGNLQPTRPHADHSSCTDDLCTGMTINDSYQARHITPGCSCGEEFSNPDAVLQVLEGDGIPLIQSTSNDSQDGNEFRIVKGTGPETDFIAISHVWAEGLGNPHSNSLPTCSLNWVSRLVNQLYRFPTSAPDSIQPFWIDTLCVPIAPREMWLRAMNRLRTPYSNAVHVLVLDSYLYTQNSSEISPMEIWARVLCCSWSRRLWTFQEARLALNLYYQFSDRAVRMEETFIAINESIAVRSVVSDMTVAYRASNVIQNLSDAFPEEIKGKFEGQFRPEPDVRDMRESLKARAVSVASDEALCLFCNMNMDMKLVTNLPIEERMPKFWSLVPKIPVGLVFSAATEKLTRKGLMWAPSTFMGDLDVSRWYLEQIIQPRVDGYPSPEGLCIQLPGFIFRSDFLIHDDSFDTLLTGQSLQLCDESGTWYFVEMFGPWNQSRTEDPGAGEQIAILLVQPTDNLEDFSSESDDPFSFVPGIQAVIGVVVSGPEYSEGREPHIEVYRHAMVHRYSVAFQRYFNQVARCVEKFVLEELGLKEVEEIQGVENVTPEAAQEDTAQEEDTTTDEDKRQSDDTTQEKGTRQEDDTIEQQEESEQDESHEEEIELETPLNFILTDDRRVRCQAFATEFVRSDPPASETALLQGRNTQQTEEESYDNFGKSARFQLQMRLRNRIRGFAQTQAWCID